MLLNINDTVKFQLTSDGCAVIEGLNKRMNELLRANGIPASQLKYDWYESHARDADGNWTEQLWKLMSIFGPLLHPSAPAYFVCNNFWIEPRETWLDEQKRQANPARPSKEPATDKTKKQASPKSPTSRSSRSQKR